MLVGKAKMTIEDTGLDNQAEEAANAAANAVINGGTSGASTVIDNSKEK
jgi:hypothetical protein